MKKDYYDLKYFSWQKKSGELAPMLDGWKFKDEIRETDCVLDFGCGGGYTLNYLNCSNKYGIEINESARKQAQEYGISVFSYLSELPNNLTFDRIISNHALEHVLNPYDILVSLKIKLKDDGLMIFFLPIDDWRVEKKYIPDDINKHLYTWTPLLIGNLFSLAGFEVISISLTSHTWIPFSRIFYKFLPRNIYNLICRIWGLVIKSRQIKIIASKVC